MFSSIGAKSAAKRLARIDSEVATIVEDLRINTEQLLQVEDEFEEARVRNLVSESPEAGHEFGEISKMKGALERDKSALARKLAKLEEKKDKLAGNA